MKLLIATRNAHKLQEIRAIFSVPGLEIIGTEAWPEVPDPIEDGTTFEANAIIKAKVWASATGLWTLADDSGLEVKALGGAPGVNSARYAGTHGATADNNAKLLRELAGVTDRAARFVCALALASPTGAIETLRGECPGIITTAPQGEGGFGYDPLFIPDGHDVTFGVLPAETKAQLSHRGHALRMAAERWGKQLSKSE